MSTMCQECGQQEATTHLTQVADGAVCKLHLCPECAEKRGVGWDPAPSVPSLMEQMGLPGYEMPVPARASCPGCHMTAADFKRTGRLGCALCYEAFQDDLADVLEDMQHSTTHTGKVPRRERERVRLSSELGALEQRLGAAVSAEAYEIAARLRDEITECRTVLASRDDGGDA
jgi:protein arginine kinase activator